LAVPPARTKKQRDRAGATTPDATKTAPRPATAVAPLRSCTRARFAQVYNAENPSTALVQAALDDLNDCHSAGEISDDEFAPIKKALIRRL
jgi:hypothetical protein